MRRGIGWFVAAAVLGLAHAVPSAYWALGGRALADTVGESARAFESVGPVGAALALGAVALVKAAAAVVPLVVELRRPRGRRFWRAVSWVGSVVLVLWGAAGTVGGILALSGAVVPDGGVDRASAAGHAFLWDPLFLAWGSALLIGLVRTRR